MGYVLAVRARMRKTNNEQQSIPDKLANWNVLKVSWCLSVSVCACLCSTCGVSGVDAHAVVGQPPEGDGLDERDGRSALHRVHKLADRLVDEQQRAVVRPRAEREVVDEDGGDTFWPQVDGVTPAREDVEAAAVCEHRGRPVHSRTLETDTTDQT